MTPSDRDALVAKVSADVQVFLMKAKQHLIDEPRVTLLYSRLIVEAILQCWLFNEKGTLNDYMIVEANKEAFGGSGKDSTGVLSEVISRARADMFATGWVHGNHGVHYSIKGVAHQGTGPRDELAENAKVALDAVEPAVEKFLWATAGFTGPQTSVSVTGFEVGFLESGDAHDVRPTHNAVGAGGTAVVSFDGAVAGRVVGEQLQILRLVPSGALDPWLTGPALEAGQRLLAVKSSDRGRVRCLVASANCVSLIQVADREKPETLATFSEPGRAAVLTNLGTWIVGQNGRLHEDPWRSGGLRLGGPDPGVVVDIDAATRGADCFIGLLLARDGRSVVRLYNLSNSDPLRRDRWEAWTDTATRLVLSRKIGDISEVLASQAEFSLRRSDFVRLDG